MKTAFLISLIFCCVPGRTSAQDFDLTFTNYLLAKDTAGQYKTLLAWQAAQADDPELQVAWFNYYLRKSRRETPQSTPSAQPADSVIRLEDPLAFLYASSGYEPQIFKQALDYIDKGIEHHPTRLDMRFGKIYVLGLVSDYKAFTEEILRTIDYAAGIRNQWTWTGGESLPDAENFMLTSIQDYQMQLFNSGEDAMLDNMSRIASAILRHHPAHVQSMSNLGLAHMLRGHFDAALDILLDAEKLSPQDTSLLYNIAHTYALKGNKQEAITYYEKMLPLADEEGAQIAREAIEKLREEK